MSSSIQIAPQNFKTDETLQEQKMTRLGANYQTMKYMSAQNFSLSSKTFLYQVFVCPCKYFQVKFRPNYISPHAVKEDVKNDAYLLCTMEGEDLSI